MEAQPSSARLSINEAADDYITAEEITELNEQQRLLTSNLKASVLNATFYGFRDLQKLQEEITETKQEKRQQSHHFADTSLTAFNQKIYHEGNNQIPQRPPQT